MKNKVNIPRGFRIERHPSRIQLLDQSLLPFEERWLSITSLSEATEAILHLRVRGAPAIALFSAYVLALELENFITKYFIERDSLEDLLSFLLQTKEALLATRPTAVNLSHALSFFEKEYKTYLSESFALQENSTSPASLQGLKERGWEIADRLFSEDAALCEALGRHAASLIPEGAGILTHCNTGALATAGIGTAIGGFYTAQARVLKNGERPILVFATETRPLLQGARLTAWELTKAGIPVTLVTDSMAAFLMQSGRVDLVMLGADRICANGDTANKIGTLGLAALARQFRIPFYVVAPSTSLDPSLSSGDKIPIEMRDPAEVRSIFGHPTAPANVSALNPAFDVTPGEWITAIITEDGIHRPPYRF